MYVGGGILGTILGVSSTYQDWRFRFAPAADLAFLHGHDNCDHRMIVCVSCGPIL
jgi:hypothetical protein